MRTQTDTINVLGYQILSEQGKTVTQYMIGGALPVEEWAWPQHIGCGTTKNSYVFQLRWA